MRVFEYLALSLIVVGAALWLATTAVSVIEQGFEQGVETLESAGR